MQLLVSSEDVDNYKQIKGDLDELRLLVEKSELWVFKGWIQSAASTSYNSRSKKKLSKLPDGETTVDHRASESSSYVVSCLFKKMKNNAPSNYI